MTDFYVKNMNIFLFVVSSCRPHCISELFRWDFTLFFFCNQEDDGALLRFLQCKFGKGRENGPDFFYDPKYALRLCLKEKRMRACVHIYSMMAMHEEAVALALQVSFGIALLYLYYAKSLESGSRSDLYCFQHRLVNPQAWVSSIL